MVRTRRGLEVGPAPADAVAALDDFTDRMVRLQPGIEAILGAAERFPEIPSVQLAAATLWLFAQTDDASAAARRHLDLVRTHESELNERERATLAAVQRWHANQATAAADTFEALTLQWPHDVLALKSLEFQYYILGFQHVAPRFLAHVESVATPDCIDPDVLAVWAFAAENTGDADRAIELADRALEVESDVPWAHHAIAHALIARGNDEEALGRLRDYEPMWKGDGRFIYCHNAWHLALVHLDQLDPGAARRLLDDVIWGVDPDMVSEQVDAISLLWRLELSGWEVDDASWDGVASHAQHRVRESFMPFVSAHHAYALARAGRTDALDVLLDTVRQRAGESDAEARRVWAPVGAPVVEACAAHGRGDLTKCAVLLEPVMGEVTAVGGSDAQTDLFRQAYLSSLIGTGRTAEARSYWARMTGWKSATSALDDAWLERL